MKKYILSIFALICCLFITGCSTVTSSVKLYIQQDGSLVIEQTCNVDFDKATIMSRLSLTESEYNDKMDAVFSEAKGYMEAFHESYKSRLTEYFVNPKLQKYSRIFGTTYNEDIYKTNTGFCAYRQFPSIYDFLLYNNYDILYIGCPHCQEKIAESEADAKLLTTCPKCGKEINKTLEDGGELNEYEFYPYARIVDFPFSGEITTKEKDFQTEYSQEALTVYKDLLSLVNKDDEPLVGKFEYMFKNGEAKFKLNDVKLKFEFITPYGRVHSNGDVKRVHGYFVHTWDIDSLDSSIVIYRNSANITAWYIVALTVSIGVTAVLLLFALVKNKLYEKAKQKAKKDTHNNLIDIIR